MGSAYDQIFSLSSAGRSENLGNDITTIFSSLVMRNSLNSPNVPLEAVIQNSILLKNFLLYWKIFHHDNMVEKLGWLYRSQRKNNTKTLLQDMVVS